ncbi:hypothetical protein NYE69_26390 [Paenibacillus sp. FSL R5-0527]|uniref:hypothetical protein n=1 Tax=Paenibacillus sp. FSL R5-0527 TaxID=2975321 RepID=UPI00097AE254|nr:hypothetical protein BK140_10520 [Paenibacillus macerans]
MIKIKFIKTLKTIGGKIRLLKKLIPIIRFVVKSYQMIGVLDLFGGGNKFIPQLDRFSIPIRIYNELDEGISNLMACLADENKAKAVIDLAFQLQDEYKTKEAFHEARKKRRSKDTPQIESAALTLIVAEFSRAGDRIKYYRPNVERGIKHKSLMRFMELVPIMRDVCVTCASYKIFFEIYGHRSDFLAILDPPYVNADCYEDSFPNWMHEEMVRTIVDTQMKVILCGTDNTIYDYLSPERGWYKYKLGEIPRSNVGKADTVQEEFIWTNFVIPHFLLSRLDIQPVYPINPIK